MRRGAGQAGRGADDAAMRRHNYRKTMEKPMETTMKMSILASI